MMCIFENSSLPFGHESRVLRVNTRFYWAFSSNRWLFVWLRSSPISIEVEKASSSNRKWNFFIKFNRTILNRSQWLRQSGTWHVQCNTDNVCDTPSMWMVLSSHWYRKLVRSISFLSRMKLVSSLSRPFANNQYNIHNNNNNLNINGNCMRHHRIIPLCSDPVRSVLGHGGEIVAATILITYRQAQSFSDSRIDICAHRGHTISLFCFFLLRLYFLLTISSFAVTAGHE